MYEEAANAETQAMNGWEPRYCPTPWCDTDKLFVKRHVEQPDAWWVTVGEEEHPWLVARKTPICPWCGGDLVTSANLGIDEAIPKILPGSQIQW